MIGMLNQYTLGHVSGLSHTFKSPWVLANGLTVIKDSLMKTHFAQDEFTMVFNCPRLLKGLKSGERGGHAACPVSTYQSVMKMYYLVHLTYLLT